MADSQENKQKEQNDVSEKNFMIEMKQNICFMKKNQRNIIRTL